MSHQPGPLPCLALCGEFSAGKSSLVNLLLACDMLPTSVLSSTRRPTYLRHAPELRIEAISDSGEREAVSPESISMLAREDVSHFDVGMPSELLRHIELLDTPGFADPFHDHQRTLDAVEGTDICVWCTLATQAWRESERQTWLSLPPRLRTNSILVVTHIDALAHGGEQQRVRARLVREAGDLFSDIVLISVPDAMRAAQADGGIADPGLWRDSGGSALVAALEKAVISCHAARPKGAEPAAATPRRGLGFQPVEVTMARVASHATAPEAAPAENAHAAPADTAPLAASQAERFLARVMETVPACLATTWIDLRGRRILLHRESEARETAASAVLGEAITDLLQGPNVQRIGATFRRAGARSEDERHYFREILIMTDDCVGVFLRSSSRPDRALAIVTDRTVNPGMVLARGRSLMASAASLP